MKAVVKTSQAPGYEYMEVDVPTIGPGDVLIKVKATTICGSDIHAFHSSPGVVCTDETPLGLGFPIIRYHPDVFAVDPSGSQSTKAGVELCPFVLAQPTVWLDHDPLRDIDRAYQAWIEKNPRN